MVHVRTNGKSVDVAFTAGMTADDALHAAGLKRPRFAKVHVGASAVRGGHSINDGDTVALAPAIRNG